MPTYEYQCPQCLLHITEKTSMALRSNKRICEKCGLEMNRLISNFNIRGEGNYSKNFSHKKTKEFFPSDRPPGMGGIRIDGGTGLLIENCRFTNLQSGISVSDNSQVEIINPQFENVRIPYEIRNN